MYCRKQTSAARQAYVPLFWPLTGQCRVDRQLQSAGMQSHLHHHGSAPYICSADGATQMFERLYWPCLWPQSFERIHIGVHLQVPLLSASRLKAAGARRLFEHLHRPRWWPPSFERVRIGMYLQVPPLSAIRGKKSEATPMASI